MSIIKSLFAVAAIVLHGCTQVSSEQTDAPAATLSDSIFVVKYGDFGPPQLSSELVGNKWWQWDSPENHKPVVYHVKVVIYRDTPLSEVKKAYPVIPEKKQDYRYVSYKDAVAYFDKTLNELEKELASDSDPESTAMFCQFPLRLYATALAMERKLRR